ncbi:uncharacterized protein BCR38DRAFT_422284 [Pseudomassariella vexata]|uniref:Uncharacterized protein n=1 Tax=Pseudomassariella vexata TaxID=1141098 RepID=A0A1Y2EI85_9PEZI|nr:uncharacterized protein BCR38DRAFT_422284 [Pseudomassariella vexata]ORY70505.1 hypothetical protein BCR38DRAFT_422284 [Pseudomassariella vexata]
MFKPGWTSPTCVVSEVSFTTMVMALDISGVVAAAWVSIEETDNLSMRLVKSSTAVFITCISPTVSEKNIIW